MMRAGSTPVVVLVVFGAVAAHAVEHGLYCVHLSPPSPFCTDWMTDRTTMPAKICSSKNENWTATQYWDGTTFQATQNASCPKNPSLVTEKMFCQTPYIPCTEGLACPSFKKLCYDLCLNGGQTKGHTFLAPTLCQDGTKTAKELCDARVTAGEVASEADSAKGECVGLAYYNTYYDLTSVAKKPFQPRACKGRFPIYNVPMVEFNAEMRVEFMKSLAKKINRIWGMTDREEPYKFYRPVNIRLRRVQLQKGVVQVYTEMKEFCLEPLRTGKVDVTLKYNEDQYCDYVSVSPDSVYHNLTKLLASKKPDRGMMIGQFNIRAESKPGFVDREGSNWPASKYCYVWQPDEKPYPPRWVWALTAIGAMCCLLSILILQHRYRNRASYVRLNEKLRSYV